MTATRQSTPHEKFRVEIAQRISTSSSREMAIESLHGVRKSILNMDLERGLTDSIVKGNSLGVREW